MSNNNNNLPSDREIVYCLFCADDMFCEGVELPTCDHSSLIKGVIEDLEGLERKEHDGYHSDYMTVDATDIDDLISKYQSLLKEDA